MPYRALPIFGTVALAVAVPILPLRFLGIPGPDFPDVSQVVTTSKNWLSSVASRLDSTPHLKQTTATPSISASPAEQVKMLDAAAQQLNTEIEHAPSDPALQNRLGLVYLSLGDIDRACDCFQRAVGLSRMGIRALSDKITAFKSQGATKEASVALLEASKFNTELSAAHSNLARVYEKRGEHDKVIAELDLLNSEGVLFDNTSAQKQNAAEKPGAMLSAQVARDLARAESFLQARQMPQAVNEYRRILAQDPTIAMAHHRLGTILAMTNNTGPGIDELEKASQLDQGSWQIQNDLGIAYQSMGMAGQATKAFERALALEPRATDAAVNLSNLYSQQGRNPDATEVLRHAIESNPKSAKAHNNLASLLTMEGKYGPAIYEFQKAVQLEPNMPSAHYGLGSALMETKNYLPAVREFKQALALNPHFVEAQVKVEEAYRKAGMSVGSVQALN